MSDPLFWLALSLLLVAVSLTAVLVALLPAVRELSRAARSAEKLFDTLNRDLPPTLDAIRRTGLELTDLTDDVSEGVQSAGRMVKQVDQSLLGVQQQAKKAQRVTRSLVVGFHAAWQTLLKPAPPDRPSHSRRAVPPDWEGDRPDRYPHASPKRYDAQDDWEDSDGPLRAYGAEKHTEKYAAHCPETHSPETHSPETDFDSAHDPDSYAPKVYSSEQYNEPNRWEDAPASEPARPDAAAPLLSRRSPTSTRPLEGEARDGFEQDLWEEDPPPLEN
ncbi:hypothetical protein [Leptolyngbya sp. O-77]|uniref:hypothetical protein n=1 Tax=Leptolyngbya sp. O-77 TaxID=1080068 RepID=UPI00074D4093|nr:hypothetical protein [Leptolyngbya sp. O-77]BAU43399.1 hypothetical protein O77CONTIG1_03228 [Leptolyngbya sp. O-77]